jgi:hypothetical protein
MVRKILTLSVLAVVPLLAQAENTYPTLERVNYVLDCMDRHGGAKIEHLTSCSCEIDEIADKVTLDEFTDANIYIQNKDTPGDKGAVFHDTQFAKDAYEKLEGSRKAAEKVCWVKVREVKRKDDAAAASDAGAAAAAPSAAASADAPAAPGETAPAPAPAAQ